VESSAADQVATKQLKKALAYIDGQVLDRLMIAGNQAVSMAARGLSSEA
jgi:DNA repair protein RadC